MPADYMIVAEMHRAAFESGPDAVAIVDNGGVMLTVNSQFELMTGRSRAMLLGQQVETLLPAYLRDQHRKHRAAYQRHPHTRLMDPGLDLMIMQRHESGYLQIPVDINLAPVAISVGVVVVVTIRYADRAATRTRHA